MQCANALYTVLYHRHNHPLCSFFFPIQVDEIPKANTLAFGSICIRTWNQTCSNSSITESTLMTTSVFNESRLQLEKE